MQTSISIWIFTPKLKRGRWNESWFEKSVKKKHTHTSMQARLAENIFKQGEAGAALRLSLLIHCSWNRDKDAFSLSVMLERAFGIYSLRIFTALFKALWNHVRAVHWNQMCVLIVCGEWEWWRDQTSVLGGSQKRKRGCYLNFLFF